LSEDSKFGEASVQSDQGFTTMSDAYSPPEDKRKTYEGDTASAVREAARDLDKARASDQVPKAEGEIPRNYVQHGGDDHGEPVPENETISLERASDDLTRQRSFEQAAQQPAVADVAAAIDHARDAYTNGQQPQQPQPEQFQAQQTTEAQPQQPPVDIPQGVDPELYQELQRSPKLRAAIEQDIANLANAQQQYTSATAAAARSAAEYAAAGILTQFEELRGLRPDQISTALSVMAKTNPQRAQAALSQLGQAKAMYDQAQALQAQQAQAQAAQQAQQLQAWVAAEDAKFEKEVLSKENPATVQKIKEALPQILQDYGLSREEVVHAFQTNPALKSAAFQSVLLDAAKHRLAQREIATKLDRSAPPVQRPGVSQPRGDDNVAAAIKAFNADPSPKAAAALVMAKRQANSRR
jgi:hypothetical protein